MCYNLKAIQHKEKEMENDIKKLREKYNISRKEFTEKFEIPYRTLQDWELGNRKCPEYLLKLIEYKLEKEQS